MAGVNVLSWGLWPSFCLLHIPATGCKSSSPPTQQHAPAPLRSSLSYHPVLPQWLLVVPVLLILSTPHPVPTLLTNTEEPDILQTLKSKALLSSRHRPLRFSCEPYTPAHVRGLYYSVQTRSLSQLRKHYIVTMWKRMKYLQYFINRMAVINKHLTWPLSLEKCF